MIPPQMLAQLSSKPGFIAALDQSGGSTPGALKLYGIPESQFHDDDEMFDLVHQMRARIMTAPPFIGGKVIATILFEDTMERTVAGQPTAAYLWNNGVAPILKVDKGLQPDSGGVSLMKPIPKLDELLERAKAHGVFATKMRSTITAPSEDGDDAVFSQQYELCLPGADRRPWPRADHRDGGFRSPPPTKPAPRPCCWRNSAGASMLCRAEAR